MLKNVALLAAFIWPLLVAAEPLELKLNVDYTDDDNVYRIPDDYGTLGIGLPPGAHRSDQITMAAVEVQSEFGLWRQLFELDLRGDAERYANNQDLDNEGGLAALRWHWRAEHAISGRVGVQYERSMADFTNNRFLQQNMLDQTSYWASAQMIVRTDWTLVGSVYHLDTVNSLAVREPDDNRVDALTLGIEYRTESADVYALDYQLSDADYDDFSSVTALDRDYADDTVAARMSRVLGTALKLDAKAGWVWREYTNTPMADYDGAIWRGALDYELGAKTHIELSTWRELEAYLSSDADYYEALGVGVTVSWKPTQRTRLGLTLSREEQEYLGVDTLTIAGRDDDVDAIEFTAGYELRDWIEFEAGYSAESRSSNRARFDYDDRIVRLSATGRW